MPIAPKRFPSSAGLVALVLCLLAATGCSKKEADQTSAAAAAPAAQDAAPAAKGVAMPSASRAMRITVETSIVVEDLDRAVAALRAETEASGGYVGEGRSMGSGDGRSASFELRIPASKVGGVRARFAKLGEVTSDAEKAEDVTEQRADLRARLSNARAQEKRLLTLLSDKTGNLAEIVSVEKEVFAVRETIERMEAQERSLEGQIAFATVKVQLSTRYAPVSLGPANRIGHAAKDGIETAWAFLVGCAVALFSVGPTLILVSAFGYGIYRAVRRIRKARRATAGVA